MPPTQYQKRIMLVSICLSFLVEMARPDINKAAHRANPMPSSVFRFPSGSVSSLPVAASYSFSSSFDLRYHAINTTIEKQIIMAKISSNTIGSCRNRHATIEIQKGLVCQVTRMSEIGAKGAARFKSRKLIWPVNIRHHSGHFSAHGNCLNGLVRAIAHQMIPTIIENPFLKRLKSATWKPSSEALRYIPVTPVPQTEKKSMAITATTLLSFFSGAYAVVSTGRASDF